MKKVLGAILVAVLVAAMPATASAAGSTDCKGGLLAPCKLLSGALDKSRQRPSLSATSNRGRGGPLPPVSRRGGTLPPVAGK